MTQARGAPAPIGERQRLDALHRYDILDSTAEGAFDDLVRLAAQICGTPAAGLSLIDADRQWFKARYGIPASQTPRSIAFSAYVILDPHHALVVPDLRADARFADNPLVAGAPHLRFYAGAPLISSDGEAIGVLSVLDYQPRELTRGQRDALEALARQAVGQLELRLALRALERKRLEMEAVQAQLAHENATDALTGIANRRAFELRLSAELARRERDGTTLALAMIDVDHFKAYNDGFGHVAGDEALRRIGTVLANTLRSYDFVARYGGEEFAVLLPATTPEGACATAERMREAVGAAGWPLRAITISIGVAFCAEVRGDAHAAATALVAGADAALYRAKAEGRNRVGARWPDGAHRVPLSR